MEREECNLDNFDNDRLGLMSNSCEVIPINNFHEIIVR